MRLPLADKDLFSKWCPLYLVCLAIIGWITASIEASPPLSPRVKYEIK